MTQIKLVFAVFGDLLKPEALSNLVRIPPTEFWNKGDLVSSRKKGLVRKETCCEYSTGFIQTLFLEDVVKKFVELINPNLDLLTKYIYENNLETKVDVIVEIENGEKPSLSIDKNLMNFVLKTNGIIDIDLYFTK